MGIETTTPNRKGNKEIYGLPVETNSHNKTRKCRRRHRKMSPVQRLYQTCKDVFSFCGAGIVPSPEDIQRLRSVLGMLVSAFASLADFKFSLINVLFMWDVSQNFDDCIDLRLNVGFM